MEAVFTWRETAWVVGDFNGPWIFRGGIEVWEEEEVELGGWLGSTQVASTGPMWQREG